VTIVVLNYNGRVDTLACLASLRRLRYPSYRVLVVDNGSRDGSVAAVREAYPEVEVIACGGNLGFAAGNNLGVRQALQDRAEYVLLLNNDTVVDPTLLDRLVDACERDPRIGATGPKIYYFDRPTVIWSAGGNIDWRRGRTSMRGLDCEDDGRFDSPSDVDFVTGCALLVRRAALQSAGLLDERFGMYYEETEWCVRIARAGWRITFVPQGLVWHKIRPAAQAQSARIIYYMTRNRLLFLRTVRAPLSAWLHALLLQDLRTWCAWRLLPRCQGYAEQRAALRSAWRDYARGRFGMVSEGS